MFVLISPKSEVFQCTRIDSQDWALKIDNLFMFAGMGGPPVPAATALSRTANHPPMLKEAEIVLQARAHPNPSSAASEPCLRNPDPHRHRVPHESAARG